jgi:hypothetical protein
MRWHSLRTWQIDYLLYGCDAFVDLGSSWFSIFFVIPYNIIHVGSIRAVLEDSGFWDKYVSVAFEKDAIALAVGDFPMPHKLEDAVLPQ